MLDRLLLFGATGDLASRFVIPAVGALYEHGAVPRDFRLTGAASTELDDDGFRRLVHDALGTHAAGLSVETRTALAARCRYRMVDFRSGELKDQIRHAIDASGAPLAAYLALPPTLFADAIRALDAAGLTGNDGSRIVVEKPFGTSLEDARSLNALVRQIESAHGTRTRTIYRVDHALGLPTLQNFVTLRFANRVIEAIWSTAHIARIEILWEETLALEGRAAFFDRTGALRDVMQNHMMQLLAFAAMEPPASLDARDVAAAKVAALRAMRSPAPEEMRSLTRRARYTAGTLPPDADASQRQVPDYAREEGVDAGRRTETFAEVILRCDTPRWRGVPFVLRAGKALRRRRKEIVVHFRAALHAPSPDESSDGGNKLHVGIDRPDDIRLELAGREPDHGGGQVPMTLLGSPPASRFHAYGHVLLDILSGGNALAIHADEAEEAWRIVTPVLDAWNRGLVPLEEYRAGSDGPPALLRAGRRAA